MAEIWLHPVSSPDSVWPTVGAQGAQWVLNALEGKLSNTAAGLELQGGEQSEDSRKRTQLGHDFDREKRGHDLKIKFFLRRSNDYLIKKEVLMVLSILSDSVNAYCY